FEEAATVLQRAGERALAVAEELAFEQRLGHRRAVDRDEGSVRADARAVGGPRDQLLPGTRLALDEHRDRRRRRALHQPEDVAHGRRDADDLREAIEPGEIATEW